MNYGDNVGIVPLTDAAGISQKFKPGVHLGIDIGWWKKHYCDVLAWQDGKVINKGYFYDTGYWIALEHEYSSKKRWTVYIHLLKGSTDKLSIGQKVELGQKIGRRGNTGKSNGEHLHFYITSQISKSIKFGNNFEVMKKYVVNPLPYLYYSKEYNTIYISKDWTKPLPAPIDEVVKPVEKDISKDQLICSISNLRVRVEPSLNSKSIGFLLQNRYYNWFKTVEADGYAWYKLAENQWCAKVDEVNILPAELYYIVEPDDTLPLIAEKNGLTLEQLVALNPQLIKIGDQIRVR